MLSRLLLTLSLALLFALGQQGAAMHAVAHLAADQQQEKSGHGTVCDQCVTYAKLGHALQGKPYAPPAVEQRHALPLLAAVSAITVHSAFYAARAPPALA